jgi:hypothetical protein
MLSTTSREHEDMILERAEEKWDSRFHECQDRCSTEAVLTEVGYDRCTTLMSTNPLFDAYGKRWYS